MSYSLNPVCDCPKYIWNKLVFRKIKVGIYKFLLYHVLCFQCYVEMRDYEEAVRWLEMGKKTPVVSQDVSTILLIGKTSQFKPFSYSPCPAEPGLILF